jgi:NADPH2:quinone reductase
MSQWARHLGARVIGIVGTEEKVKIAKDSGCDHVIVRSKDDIVSMVMELTGGQGVPVVYDSVGMSTFDISLDCLAKKGTLVSFGTASGPIPPFDIFRLNNNHHLGSGGSKFVTSASVFDYTRDRSEYLARVSDLFEVVQSGAVKISINNKFPLSQANLAHRQLESGTTSGATILEI